jgi:ribonuclease HII
MPLAASKPKPTLELERALLLAGKHLIAGVDEVGVGAIAGPLIAVAVVLPLPGAGADIDQGLKELAARLDEVRDIHHLYSDQREKLYFLIEEVAQPQIGFGIIEVDELSQLNNQEQAAILARTRAVEALPARPDFVLLDGRVRIEGEIPFGNVAKVNHGTSSLTVAAASIMAGVAHQRLMQEQDRRYPVYGFGHHHGNISPAHLAALAQYGPSPIHHLHNRVVQGFQTPSHFDPEESF